MNEEKTGWMAWLVRNQKWVYAIVAALVGLLGGNADRVDEFLPDLTNSTLEKRVSDLEANQCNCPDKEVNLKNFERKYE